MKDVPPTKGSWKGMVKRMSVNLRVEDSPSGVLGVGVSVSQWLRGRCLGVLRAAFNVFRPITHVLIGVED